MHPQKEIDADETQTPGKEERSQESSQVPKKRQQTPAIETANLQPRKEQIEGRKRRITETAPRRTSQRAGNIKAEDRRRLKQLKYANQDYLARKQRSGKTLTRNKAKKETRNLVGCGANRIQSEDRKMGMQTRTLSRRNGNRKSTYHHGNKKIPEHSLGVTMRRLICPY